MKPLWARLRAGRKKDIKAKQDKSRADWGKIYADREKEG
jgi:hypothetical protein